MNSEQYSCDDTVTPRAALSAAVRYVRREVNDKLDEIEKALRSDEEVEIGVAIEVRLKEPAR